MGLASMAYTFFDKKPLVVEKFTQTEELHKPIIRNFKKRKVHSSFTDTIWGADLADKQLMSKFNKRFRFLLCVIDIFSKYIIVISLKDKKCTTITNAFQILK